LNAIYLEQVATPLNFDEAAYLDANPDIQKAVEKGQFRSGWHHFEVSGHKTGKRIRFPNSLELISEAKIRKHEKIRPLLRNDMTCVEAWDHYDYLADDLRTDFNIIDTDNVSSHQYDEKVINLIQKHSDGLVLDCGCGRRPVYFENIVNYEIVAYDTTDVIGVGEILPFVDDCFDAVISMAVLEHVKDPFRCAKELARVLKPGGDLICSVPFLQPMHAYPHHYYNMTPYGLKNLFEESLIVDGIQCYGSMRPIGSLTWILSKWAFGLEGQAREEFLNMRVADLVNPPEAYFERRFVKELSTKVNFEIASANILFAHKEFIE
jgi:SAM-dependent methyltransferase